MPITAITNTSLKEAAACLEKGGLVAFPTETVYGLGALATDDSAVVKIFAAKNRPQFNPLISHFADKDSALKAGLPNKIAENLAACFWPGPLTILFKPKQTIPKNITTGLIGIRQPGNLITRKILAGLNYPLTAPSANFSGEDPTTTAEQVKDRLGKKVDLILDAGICRGGQPSTLVDSTKTPVRLVRAGAINFKSIQESLNETPQV